MTMPTPAELLAAAARCGACTEGLREARRWIGAHQDADWRAAARALPEYAGWVARFAPGLSAEQRFALARESTPYWRGLVARFAPGLSAEQRVALARKSTLYWRGEFARNAPGLTDEQRAALNQPAQRAAGEL